MAYKIVKSGDFRERRNFSRIRNTYELKDLLEIQKKSYNWFIETGIKEVFTDLFPVENFSGTLSLEFGDYHFDEPKYSIKESKDRETTFSAPLRVEVRLFNRETGEVKEQEIFMGDMPIMTESGTFVINGAERVIVSQLVRSPSVYFNQEIDKNGRELITSQIIPTRGTWLEYEVDSSSIREALSEIITDDYFSKIPAVKNSKELKSEIEKAVASFIDDNDLEDDLADAYEDELKEHFEEEAFDSLDG